MAMSVHIYRTKGPGDVTEDSFNGQVIKKPGKLDKLVVMRAAATQRLRAVPCISKNLRINRVTIEGNVALRKCGAPWIKCSCGPPPGTEMNACCNASTRSSETAQSSVP